MNPDFLDLQDPKKYNSKNVPKDVIEEIKFKFSDIGVAPFYWWHYWRQLDPDFPLTMRMVMVKEHRGKFYYRHPVYRLAKLINKGLRNPLLSLLGENGYLREEDLYAFAYVLYGAKFRNHPEPSSESQKYVLGIINRYYQESHKTEAIIDSWEKLERHYLGWSVNQDDEIKENLVEYNNHRDTDTVFATVSYATQRFVSLYDEILEMQRDGATDDQIDDFWDKNIEPGLEAVINNNPELYEPRLKDVEQYDIDALGDFVEAIRLDRSELKFTNTEYNYHPTFQGRRTTLLDGEDIFNSAQVSPYVTSVQYVGESVLTKIYGTVGGDKIRVPNKEYLRQKNKRSTLKQGTLTLRIWCGDEERGKSYVNASNEAFTTALYDVEENILIVTWKDVGKESATIERLRNALPEVNLGEAEIKGVKAMFNFWNTRYSNYLLTHLVINDPLVRSFFSVKEAQHPVGVKKMYELVYNSYQPIKSRMSNDKLSKFVAATPIYNEENTRFLDSLDAKTSYIRVYISGAESKAAVYDFIKVFRIFLRYAYLREPEIEKIYRGFDVLNEQDVEIIDEGQKRRHLVLMSQFPEVFQKKYAQVCAGDKQPIIIPDELVEEYTQTTFMHMGKMHYRQAMPFPPVGERLFYFGSDSKRYPFPRLVVNKLMANRDVYPLVPSCGEADEMDPENAKSNYNRWIRGENFLVQSQQGTSSKIKRLPDPFYGVFLPQGIFRLIAKEIGEEVTSDQIYALGLTRSFSTLLHGVLLAVGNRGYAKLRSHEARERFVQNYRAELAQRVQIEILLEQLYDLDEEQIRAELGNPHHFLDASRYYRALEEEFRVNIFVFHIPKSGSDAGYGDFTLPRYHDFLVARKNPLRPSVLFMTYENNFLPVPQYAVIIYKLKDDGGAIYAFGRPVTTSLTKALQERARSFVQVSDLGNDRFLDNHNWFSLPNYLPNALPTPDVKESIFTGQLIDPYGKTYALVGPKITVFIPRTQPYPLPRTQEAVLADYQYVKKLIPLQVAAVTSKHGQIDGVWFELFGVQEGLYVPVRPESTVNDPELKKLPQVVNDLNPEHTEDHTRLIQHGRRTVMLLEAVLIWLYEYRYTKYDDGHGREFIEKFWRIDSDWDSSNPEDTLSYYELSRIPSDLTNVQGIEDLGRYAPSLIHQEFIWFPDENTFNHLARRFLDLIHLRDQLSVTRQNIIVGFYRDNHVFKSAPNTYILRGQQDIENWIKLGNKSNEQYTIHKLIPKDGIHIKEPYLFEKWTDVIFMIQNTVEHDLNSALYVADMWVTDQGINYGYNTIPPDDWSLKNLSYIINVVDPTGNIFMEKDARKSPDDTEYLEILHYGESNYQNYYAAMLRIL
jgi:hypothetical protein